MQYKLKDLQEKYELELERIISEIKKENPKSVLLQFPDGLKPYATEITDYIQSKTSADVRIWLGSCFGACDIPKTDADLVIQFGHAEW
jgi:2-(3-amino-3-carboxypropyl)histidine synthase